MYYLQFIAENTLPYTCSSIQQFCAVINCILQLKKINSKCMKLAWTRNVTIYSEIFAPVLFSSDSSSTSVKFKTEQIQNNFLIKGLIRLCQGKFCISIQSEYSIYGRSKWVTLLYIFRCWVHVHIPCTQ